MRGASPRPRASCSLNLDEITHNSSQIAKETMSFEYVECNRKDVGLNVRKKAETVQPSQGEGCCYEG